MLKPSVIFLLLAVGCAASTQDIKRSEPVLAAMFSGTQKGIAACAAERLVDAGQFQITPVLRDAEPGSSITGYGMSMGEPFVYWELRFQQVNPERCLVELRARKVVFDTFSKETDPTWQSVVQCGTTSVRASTKQPRRLSRKFRHHG